MAPISHAIFQMENAISLIQFVGSIFKNGKKTEEKNSSFDQRKLEAAALGNLVFVVCRELTTMDDDSLL